jgi:hypothetical protein
MKIAVVVGLALLASAAPALAQEQQPVPGPAFEQRFAELSKWLHDYRAWEKWYEQWGNRIARNFNDQPIWERQQRPDPPVWLAAECQGYLGADDMLSSACQIVRNWDDQPLLILQRRRSSLATSGGKVNDKVVKSSFFQRVHLTGLWMQARYPATPTYGIVGMQIGVFETGRFTLPAIGVMLVTIPDGDGGHAWKPATTVGFGFRICDFVPPLIKRQASLHFNIARTNLHGVQDERILPGMVNVNLFGLSVSAKRRR